MSERLGISISVILLIDNMSGPETPPFEGGIFSVWDLRCDYDLLGCKDAGFLMAVGAARGGPEPLFKERGLPPLPKLLDAYDDLATSEVLVSWLSYRELLQSLAHVSRSIDSLEPPMRAVVETMALLASQLGVERVRIVFGIWN